MLLKNNIAIIGTSPDLKNANIEVIKKEFITVGLNSVPFECDYRMVVDNGTALKVVKPNERLIIPTEIQNELKTDDKGRILKDFIYKPFDVFDLQVYECFNSVVEPAILYFLDHGADNILLVGVDLTNDWQPKHRTDVTKAIIEKCKNVYKINPKNEINIPLWKNYKNLRLDYAK